MSRRVSASGKKERSKPKVHFPAELVFLDSIKENDLKSCSTLLTTASQKVDINAVNDSGLTPLHTAVLEDNIGAVRLLLEHGADVNKTDTDTWTPLHAACSEGHAEIVRLLLWKGAKKEMKTQDGERALDLIDASDLQTIGAMLESDAARDARMNEVEDDQSSVAASEDESSVAPKKSKKG